MKGIHHDNLIRDTRPNAQVINKATDAFWSLPLSSLLRSKIEAGQNQHGMQFEATFKIEGERIRMTLTPTEDRGSKKHTHLTTWQWMPLAPKVKGDDSLTIKEEQQALNAK
jgi:hypothetical protein